MQRQINLLIASILLALALKPSPLEASREKPAYAGVKLGQSRDHVRYVLGYPPEVVDNALSDWQGFKSYRVYQTDGRDPKNALPNGTSIDSFWTWSYPREGGRIDVKFSESDGKTERISCFSLGFTMCPSIYGVSIGQSESAVLAGLGTPDKETFVSNAKELEYEDFGLTLTLTQGRVYIIALHR